MPSKPTKREQATAYHEAGHAVAAYMHDTKVPAISIVPDADSLGHCEIRTPKWFKPELDRNSPRVRCKVEAEIVGLFAGRHAERRITGRNNWRGASGDQGQATDLALYLFPDDEVRIAYLRYLDKRAEAFVGNPMHWAGIKELARVLLERKKLSGRDAIAAMVVGFDDHARRMGWAPLNFIGQTA